MSNIKHTSGEHGSVGSYVVGFVLSLIFTAIPYYLVVNKTITGTAILLVILGFALAQMLVQIFFFLHLGRGPKPFYNIAFFGATFGLILVVVGGSIFIMNSLHYMTPSDATKKIAQGEGIAQIGGQETGACQQKGERHHITLADGKATPTHVNAKLCDTITFFIGDTSDHEIVFGTTTNKLVYGGEEKLGLRRGRGKVINLNEAGSFTYFDSKDTTITGTFTVQP